MIEKCDKSRLDDLVCQIIIEGDPGPKSHTLGKEMDVVKNIIYELKDMKVIRYDGFWDTVKLTWKGRWFLHVLSYEE
jgi:hypothetical protein